MNNKILLSILQKLIGVGILVLTAVFVRWNGYDATPALLTVPFGLALIFSKSDLLDLGFDDKRNKEDEEDWD